MSKKLFFIDPQSYNNLSIYDTLLMSNIEGREIHYYHNVKYQCEKLPSLHYHPVFAYSDKHGVSKALSYVGSICRVAFDAIRLRPSAVHIQWFRLYQIDSLLVMLFHLLGIKVVHTAHNVMPHNPTKSAREHFQWYYSHADTIIVHAERSKDELLREFRVPEEKIQVVPHGIMPSIADEADVRKRTEELKADLHLDGKVVFACMGFQNHYKGIDIVSDVWSRCRQLNKNNDCELLVIGQVENADVSTLEKFDNVHVVNEIVSDVDFDAYLRLASVALLPYRTISQSGVLLTALQREVPVLVSDVGGLTDPLKIGKVGWCMGEPTADNLEKSMLQLLNNPEEMKSCRENKDAFGNVKNAFSWKRIGEMTSRLYMLFLAFPFILMAFALVFSMQSFAQGKPVLWDMDALARITPASSTYQSKVQTADEALAQPLLSVTTKEKCISGNKHNYESLAYYAWPDENNPEGPYIEKDGQPSPEYKYYDGEKLTQLHKRIVALGEAYYVTKDKRYAKRCVEQINTWFLNKSTKMNPNFTHGQFIPGKRNGEGFAGSISEAYFFVDIIECISMLREEGQLKKSTDKKLRKWFRQYELWLQTSPLGQEMHGVNDNLATIYDVLLYRICMYTGDKASRRKITDEFESLRLDGHIAEDGAQTIELKRTKAMMYSIYNLQHIIDFCRMCQYDGNNYYADHQKYIDSAVQFIAKYIENPTSFPYKEIGDWNLYKRQFATLKAELQQIQTSDGKLMQ